MREESPPGGAETRLGSGEPRLSSRRQAVHSLRALTGSSTMGPQNRLTELKKDKHRDQAFYAESG